MPPRRRSSTAIVVAPQAELVPRTSPQELQEAIEAMVRKRVDEILSIRNAGELDPDFEPRNIANNRLLRKSMFERKKWALYFDKWGCRGCGKKDVSHSGTGHCVLCYRKLQLRLLQIEKEFNAEHSDAEIHKRIDDLTSRTRTARELLGG